VFIRVNSRKKPLLSPDGFHLFAAGNLPDDIIIKGVPRLSAFRGPQDNFGRVREIAAAQVGRRIGFFPA
jgi:hypothetical protein